MKTEEHYDEIARCNRCGFCQVACPIFRATGHEAGVARGRVALLRALLEKRIGWDRRAGGRLRQEGAAFESRPSAGAAADLRPGLPPRRRDCRSVSRTGVSRERDYSSVWRGRRAT